MITAAHNKTGKIIITTDDRDDMGDATQTDRVISLEEAVRIHNELGDAIEECRKYVVMDAKMVPSPSSIQILDEGKDPFDPENIPDSCCHGVGGCAAKPV